MIKQGLALAFIYMIELLITIGASVYAWLSWKSQKRGLAILLAFLPAYLLRFEVLGVPTNVLELMVLVFTTVFVARLSREKGARDAVKKVFSRNKYFHLFVLFFLVSACISAAYAFDPIRTLGILKAYFIEPVIVLYLILSVFTSKKDIKNVLTLSSLPVFTISVVGIVQFFGIGLPIPEGYGFPERRATSIFPYPAALAWYILPHLVMYALFFLNVPRSKYKKAYFKSYSNYYRFFVSYWVVVFTATAGLLLSKAEGAIGAFAAVLYLNALYTRKYRLFAAVLGVVGVGSVLLIGDLRTYLWEVVSFQNVSGEVRLALWEGTINLLKERPLIGAGLASFPEVYDQFRLARHVELLLYPHNILLNFWVELGLFGLVAFLGMLGIWMQKVVKGILSFDDDLDRAFIISIFGAMIATLIYGLVDVPYFKNDLAVLFLFNIAAALILLRKGPAGKH